MNSGWCCEGVCGLWLWAGTVLGEGLALGGGSNLITVINLITYHITSNRI